MTDDQLRECRDAFDRWYADNLSGKRAIAWMVWQAAWNIRAQAEDGEAVAWLEVEPGVSLEQATGEHGVLIHSMRVHVGRHQPTKAQEANGLFPLCAHPPRAQEAGGGARDEVIVSMRELANTFRRVEPNIIEKQAVVYRYAADQIDKTIDAAMAARGGEKAA